MWNRIKKLFRSTIAQTELVPAEPVELSIQDQAKIFLRGPICVPRGEPEPTGVSLIQQYAEHGTLTDTQFQAKLPQCIRYLEAKAASISTDSVPGRDARWVYEREVAILRAIYVELRAKEKQKHTSE